MTEKITYSINVQVADGPRISESRTLELEAYDKIHLDLSSDATNEVEVNLQPGGEGLAKFLVITASCYGDKLTYKVNEAADTNNPDPDLIPLDGPQLFAGEGAVDLLASSPTEPPTKFFFTNSTGEDVTIQILVARDATP